MSLEDGMEALVSRHTKGQEEEAQTALLGDRGGSTHANEKIGHFKVDVMWQCIDEINRVEAEAKQHGTKPKS